MAIGTVMESGRSVYIYDEKGKQIGSIGLNFDEDELSGYSSSTVSIKRGGTTYLYNENGRMISSVHDPFYSKKSNNSKNSNNSGNSNNSSESKSKKGCGWFIFIIILIVVGYITEKTDHTDKPKSSVNTHESTVDSPILPENDSSKVVNSEIIEEKPVLEEGDNKSLESDSSKTNPESIEEESSNF